MASRSCLPSLASIADLGRRYGRARRTVTRLAAEFHRFRQRLEGEA